MFTSLYEYDEEKHIKNEKKISYDDGVNDANASIVKKMLQRKVPVEDIMDYTNLSREEISEIAKINSI